MSKKITIIGAGPGGYTSAIRAAQLGAEVTIIEKENVGGTCLNWGCIPSKVMKTTSEMLDKLQKAEEYGIKIKGEVYPDINRLMARKNSVIQNQKKGILKLLHLNKIRFLEGIAKIDDAGLVTTKLSNGETLNIPHDNLILAMGSEPQSIGSFPFDGEKIISSNEIFNIDKIPESLLILGGGVVGCEFSFIFSSLGSKVTLVEALSRVLPLPSVDEDCSKTLQREMKKRKIKVLVDQTVKGVEDYGDRLGITIAPSTSMTNNKMGDAKPFIIETEKILVCVGRKPATEGLGLKGLGINLDEKGWIKVNENMRTNISNIYAIGDVLGPDKIMLAHAASSEGHVAAENCMGEQQKMRYDLVPSAIFTSPEVACVGLTETEAKEQDYNFGSESVLFRNLGKAQVIGEIAGQVKIIWDQETEKILGVHMIGPHTTDLIAEGTLAIQSGVTLKELSETIHAHPTLAEIMAEVSLKALGKPLHG